MRAIYSLFYSSGNRDTEKLGNLLKITQFSKNFQANLCQLCFISLLASHESLQCIFLLSIFSQNEEVDSSLLNICIYTGLYQGKFKRLECNVTHLIPKYSFIIFFKIFYFFRERAREGERGKETSQCGCLLSTPYWGPGPQPRHVP